MSNFTIHGAMDHHHVCLRRPLCITGRPSSAHLQMSKTGRILFCLHRSTFLSSTYLHLFSLFVILSTRVLQKIKDPLHIGHPFSACVYLSLKMTNQSNVIDVRQMLLVNIVPVHWQKARGKRGANPWQEMRQFGMPYLYDILTLYFAPRKNCRGSQNQEQGRPD